jgi:hypothetical protein
LVDRPDELLVEHRQPGREQRYELGQIGADSHHAHGCVIAGDGRNLRLHRGRPVVRAPC